MERFTVKHHDNDGYDWFVVDTQVRGGGIIAFCTSEKDAKRVVDAMNAHVSISTVMTTNHNTETPLLPSKTVMVSDDADGEIEHPTCAVCGSALGWDGTCADSVCNS